MSQCCRLSFIECLLSSQTFQPIPSYLINLLMLPPSFPVGSLLFLHLGMTKPPGREVVLLVLLLVSLRENEPALLKLHQCEPIGCILLWCARAVGRLHPQWSCTCCWVMGRAGSGAALEAFFSEAGSRAGEHGQGGDVGSWHPHGLVNEQPPCPELWVLLFM